ncbi:Exopolyphosphatase [hydrothermal vent metagenome]|uniref:Exopolyphosphatase n=1 Tax=hydrothermal vent metagenome TaxID=652676 RepID=A0A3B1BAC8_9ZZZZ
MPKMPETIAAVDLGSNSFHMIVARITNGDIQIIDRLREMVRLGAGLDENKCLTPEAKKRAIACLMRFGQRLQGLPPNSVRAVGTNTMRQARQADDFLRAAEAALGHPIEVIAGHEEARLVYLGVAHSLATGGEQRLVVDIGGGSTELIIGRHFDIIRRESLYIGCVSLSRTHFPDGRITPEAMETAALAAALDLRPIRHSYREVGWQTTIGSSGTIRSINEVVYNAGWSKNGITLQSLQKLRQVLLEAGHVEQLHLEGLSQERQAVFPGGVAALIAIFKTMRIEQMQISDQALREGLLYDKLGRIRHEDVRERSIRSLCQRYHIDPRHAAFIEATANTLLNQIAEEWGLNSEEDTKILCWAARLHELGLTVSHSQYHKHGAYLIEGSDLSGFSNQEQALLAALVRGHRRRFPLEVFDILPANMRDSAKRLCVLLRLAILLHRGRSYSSSSKPQITVAGDTLTLKFPDDWLRGHPLTRMELRQEQGYLSDAEFRLIFA